MKKRFTRILSLLLLCAGVIFRKPLPRGTSLPRLPWGILTGELQIALLIKNSCDDRFRAAWCGPCKMLNPIMAELEKESKEKLNL
jgi:thiol-disulfide isomerase/thioredoxin